MPSGSQGSGTLLPEEGETIDGSVPPTLAYIRADSANAVLGPGSTAVNAKYIPVSAANDAAGTLIKANVGQGARGWGTPPGLPGRGRPFNGAFASGGTGGGTRKGSKRICAVAMLADGESEGTAGSGVGTLGGIVRVLPGDRLVVAGKMIGRAEAQVTLRVGDTVRDAQGLWVFEVNE